jgi:CheY-like chemotaxis protein
MALPLSPEQVTLVRHHVELLVEQTTAHQKDIAALAASAERDMREAHTIGLLTQFLDTMIASDTARANVAEIRSLLCGYVERTASDMARARQLCASAGEQHAAACGLLSALNGGETFLACGANSVLVVDDHEEVRGLVADVLRNAGFVVRTAANGLEALIAAYETRPAVIVMDVTMPVLDGIEATRLIKANEATRGARVIAYTGASSLDTTLVERLFSAVLQKPAAAAVLVATVQHVAGL